MSELINIREDHANFRKALLATASAIVLTACVSSLQQALAVDADRPTVWIEGGWHFDSVSGTPMPFVPGFDAGARQAGFTPVADLQNILASSYGAEGSISFQPKHSDWVFSVSGRYGRTTSRRHVHEEKDFPGSQFVNHGKYDTATATAAMPTGYNEVRTTNAESHAIIDFQAGKDVGLGLMGRNSVSVASFGVRYAQMTRSSQMDAYVRPEGHFEIIVTNSLNVTKINDRPIPFHSSWSAMMQRSASFHGVGPTVSWSNTTPLLGNDEAGEIAFDWGANAALLFGRQRLKGHHQSAEHYHSYMRGPSVLGVGKYSANPVATTSYDGHDMNRTRSVIVPNIGGFAGLSYRFPNAKLSAGYRADFFFGAMDGGLDTRKSVTMGFHGPFATIAIGLGG